MSKKVLFVVGSLREKSFNRTVAEYISKKLEEISINAIFLIKKVETIKFSC